MDPNPLVSIVVLTYNSSSTIIETLDSIKEQSYLNIELIISDDCSKDKTVLLCKEWILHNSNSLRRIELVESPSNTGVSANLNRGIRRAKGEWIKSIAGDDTLISNAIDSYVCFVQDHPGCRICMAKLEKFSCNKSLSLGNDKYLNRMYSVLSNHDKKKQYRRALIEHILPGPGIFYQKSLWNEIGGFDERYNLQEERPFEIKVTSLTPIYYLNKAIVRWRVSENSLSNNRKSVSYQQCRQYYWDELRSLVRKEYGFFAMLDCDLYYKYEETEVWYYRLLRFLSPYYYIRVFLWN